MHRFESLDLLSPKPKLFINSKKRYITILGIVLSFLIFLGYLSMIIYFFVEFLIGSGVTVVYSKEEITSDFYFNLTGKLFAFYLTDLATNSINPSLFIFKFKEIHIGFFVIVYKTISDEKVVQYYISKLELLSVLLDFYRETPSVLITKIQKSKLIEKNRIQKLTKKETKENSLQATDFAIENDNTIDYDILNKSYNSTIIFNYIIYTILLFSLYYIMCVIFFILLKNNLDKLSLMNTYTKGNYDTSNQIYTNFGLLQLMTLPTKPTPCSTTSSSTTVPRATTSVRKSRTP